MNREIKFRVWDSYHKLFWHDPKYFRNSWKPFLFSDGGIAAISGSEWNVVDGGDLVVQQFTGLKDSTGKEIYEGDLLLFCDSKSISEVVYKYGAFWVEGENFLANELLFEWVGSYRVIGNIFENKDLLNDNRPN